MGIAKRNLCSVIEGRKKVPTAASRPDERRENERREERMRRGKGSREGENKK